ncbi:MAG: hypothetical protein AAF560_08255 [Acidobacteriota bacterium]
MRYLPTLPRLGLLLVAALALALGSSGETTDSGDAWLAGEFKGDRAEVQKLMDHYEAIRLTPEQEKIRREALGPIPAACCNEFSMATCCCECNLSRSLWGLSKYLIVEKQADAKQVRDSVTAWIEVLNPDGYEGNTCQTGRCNLPFDKGGCGGMNKHRLIHDHG